MLDYPPVVVGDVVVLLVSGCVVDTSPGLLVVLIVTGGGCVVGKGHSAIIHPTISSCVLPSPP